VKVGEGKEGRKEDKGGCNMAHTIPQINIQDVLASTMDPVHHPQQDPAVVSREPGTAPMPIIPPTSTSRVGRIARKPLTILKKGLRIRNAASGATMTGKTGDPAAQARERALAARGRTRPVDGEKEVARVRVRVVRCEGLVVRDRKSSDP
jgi:hypothetical protein